MKFRLRTVILIALAVTAVSCGPKKRNPLKGLKQAKGDVYYGGSFHYNEVTNFRSLYPLNMTDVVSVRLASQVYEGLVAFNLHNLVVEPMIAESWEVDSSNTVYTFRIRRGVRFHDDTCFSDDVGREVTAADVKYCLDKLCESSQRNQGYQFVKGIIKGSDAYFMSTAEGEPLPGGVSGIQMADNFTLVITLNHPYPNLLNILATPYGFIYPQEAFETYGDDMRIKMVGTGPFIIKDLIEDKAIIMVKNREYWGKDPQGNHLPYLDAIKVSFIIEQKSELLEFKKGNLDLVYRLPLELVEEIIDNKRDLKGEYIPYQLQKSPGLNIQYYGFQHKSDLFSNRKVRQAFNYAIDRRKISDFTLKGTGIPAVYGFVPPALIGYDAKSVKGFEYDPDKAKSLLEEAGYPNGVGFPEVVLQISSSGGRNEQVAEAIDKMLEENLNIIVDIHKLPLSQHYENIETGKAIFWRAGWRADFPDVETFLTVFLSRHVPEKLSDRSYLNPMRYMNPEFDTLFNLVQSTVDEDERFGFALKSDSLLIEDAVIMPIYYDQDYRLLQPYVRNFHQNPMEYRNFRMVYFHPSGQKPAEE